MKLKTQRKQRPGFLPISVRCWCYCCVTCTVFVHSLFVFCLFPWHFCSSIRDFGFLFYHFVFSWILFFFLTFTSLFLTYCTFNLFITYCHLFHEPVPHLCTMCCTSSSVCTISFRLLSIFRKNFTSTSILVLRFVLSTQLSLPNVFIDLSPSPSCSLSWLIWTLSGRGKTSLSVQVPDFPSHVFAASPSCTAKN